VKKGSNIKNLNIILFAYSRGVQKSCRPKGSWVMVICLCHIKTIVLNQSFLIDFISVYIEERKYKSNLTHHLILLFMANMMVQIATLHIIVFASYSSFSLCLLYKSILLMLVLWRVLKLFGILGGNFAKAYIWLCRLWIFNSQKTLCQVFADPVTYMHMEKQIHVSYVWRWVLGKTTLFTWDTSHVIKASHDFINLWIQITCIYLECIN